MSHRAPPEGRRRDGRRPSFVSPALVAFSVLVILSLLALVIVVGIYRDNLDTTAVASVLSTLFSGIVVGALWQRRDGRPGEDVDR